MRDNSEENTQVDNKNLTKLDEELELEINKVNNAFRTLAEGIKSVYDLAIKKGYEPFEAREIVENRIINVTPQYMRRILPDEAKQTQMRRSPIAKHVSQSAKLIHKEPEEIVIPNPRPIIQDAEEPPKQAIDTKEKEEYYVRIFFAGKDVELKIIATNLIEIIPPNKYVRVVIH